ncbi:MAG TPA: tetratricopeptide repeat protein [Accumulibacter sp.]|nr:tetratricopeptide repeat protein [Accumulibacter sp.]HMW18387.1 tetratricopeptide repeat protein [Accumulibacter sp.]HMX23753.1 tetratricopeptide repeat protein [Accumulibacter sp.]HMY07718.1 tetratricopeptide repeat protein [Accumulibacter sp.]HNC18419.1 tetratricopeptide repeat protein [Accumulibacter sp.]
MSTTVIANLEKLLDGPRDGALLRYSLGNELFKAGDWAAAAQRLHEAVDRDPEFSAAWKLLGKTLAENGQINEAMTVYKRGIAVAEKKGDLQAVKEMRVFLRRLERRLDE